MSETLYICKSCEGVYMIPVTQCDCMPEKQEFTEMVMIEPEELERLRTEIAELVQERDRLCITVKDLSGAMLSVNRSRNQKIMIEGDDEPITKYVELTREQAFEHLKTNSFHLERTGLYKLVINPDWKPSPPE